MIPLLDVAETGTLRASHPVLRQVLKAGTELPQKGASFPSTAPGAKVSRGAKPPNYRVAKTK